MNVSKNIHGTCFQFFPVITCFIAAKKSPFPHRLPLEKTDCWQDTLNCKLGRLLFFPLWNQEVAELFWHMHQASHLFIRYLFFQINLGSVLVLEWSLLPSGTNFTQLHPFSDIMEAKPSVFNRNLQWKGANLSGWFPHKMMTLITVERLEKHRKAVTLHQGWQKLWQSAYYFAIFIL